MLWILLLTIVVGFLVVLARMRVSLRVWVGLLLCADMLLLWAGMAVMVGVVLLLMIVAVFVLFGLDDVRKQWISRPLMGFVRRAIPPMSDTERDAIEAGSVWWDAELFQGDPDWTKLLSMPAAQLSPDEQAFLNGPVDELCGMLDDWQISHQLHDLAPDVWAFIKQNGFFAMIIPKQYGGLAFSAYVHA